jgi:hypothetical protein
MVAARKIPPHFARELKRHVIKQTQSSSSSTSHNNSTVKTLFGCVAFAGVTASIPYFALQWIAPLNDREDALTHSQIRRGAFNNSGSRDAGRDPNWDFKTGTRIKNDEYMDLFLKDNPNEIEHGDRFKP